MNVTPKFYINPDTGRLIKSTGRVFRNLRKHRVHVDKHVCLYNTKSVERCIKKILTLYPDTLYPPSSLIEIPKTFDHGSIRAFIKDTQTGMIIGYIDKRGHKFRLQQPIENVTDVPIVQDHYNVLASLVKSLQPIHPTEQTVVESHLITHKPLNDSQNIIILFNPLKNDFIPINATKTTLDHHNVRDVLRIMNQELIPKNLFPIRPDYDIAGIVRDDSVLYGIVDINNRIKRFQEPIPIDSYLLDSDDHSDRSDRSDRSGYTAPEIQHRLHDIENNVDDLKKTVKSINTKVGRVSTEVKQINNKVGHIESVVNSIADTMFEIFGQTPHASAKTTQQIVPKTILDTLPEVTVINQQDTEPLSETLTQAPVIKTEQQKEIIDQITCLDGEQYDVNEKRCLPCDRYNLVWDPVHKLCKPMLKTDIQSLQTQASQTAQESQSSTNNMTESIKLLFNGNDDLVGYL